MPREDAALSPRSVVFDTSAIFAALTSESGAARQLLHFAYRGEILPVTCSYILDEATRNLARKAPAAISLLEQIRSVIDWRMVEPTDALVRDVSQLVEGKDAPVVASAIAAGAASVVTFDRRHLLSIADAIAAEFGVRVIEPSILLHEIRSCQPR